MAAKPETSVENHFHNHRKTRSLSATTGHYVAVFVPPKADILKEMSLEFPAMFVATNHISVRAILIKENFICIALKYGGMALFWGFPVFHVPTWNAGKLASMTREIKPIKRGNRLKGGIAAEAGWNMAFRGR